MSTSFFKLLPASYLLPSHWSKQVLAKSSARVREITKSHGKRVQVLDGMTDWGHLFTTGHNNYGETQSRVRGQRGKEPNWVTFVCRDLNSVGERARWIGRKENSRQGRKRNSKGPETNVYSAWLRNNKEAGAQRKEESGRRWNQTSSQREDPAGPMGDGKDVARL